jgi:hypothetical protein
LQKLKGKCVDILACKMFFSALVGQMVGSNLTPPFISASLSRSIKTSDLFNAIREYMVGSDTINYYHK